MLKKILNDSELLVTTSLGRAKDKIHSNQIPAISEIYSFFQEYLYENGDLLLENIQNLPSDFRGLKVGIYQKNNQLICVSKIPAGCFKYLTLFCSGVMAESKLSPTLSGLYFCSLVMCEDGTHYEPEAFTYLFQDNFFKTDSDKNVIPFLALPTTIPPALEYQWVYLAIYKLNRDFNPIEYRYLATESKEIELLKMHGFY